jgi:hypothetical protein
VARKRRKRSMPAGLRRYWASRRGNSSRRRRRSNPSRRMRMRTRTNTIIRYRTRGRRRSNPRRMMRRYGNPMFAGMTTTDLLYMGGGALVNGIITRAVPASIPQLMQYNNGVQGYALNVVVGGAAAWGIGKINRRAGQGAWIGMIVAVGQRIVAEHFGSGMAAPAAAQAAATPGMSGDMDFALGYYTEEPFPFAQGAAGGPYGTFPGTPYAGQAAFPTTSASAVRAGQAAAQAALAPAGAMAPAGTVAQASAQNAPGWGAHGWA